MIYRYLQNNKPSPLSVNGQTLTKTAVSYFEWDNENLQREIEENGVTPHAIMYIDGMPRRRALSGMIDGSIGGMALGALFTDGPKIPLIGCGIGAIGGGLAGYLSGRRGRESMFKKFVK